MEIEAKVSYTREDYEALPEGAPYQLIEGKLIMSPAPTSWHQIIIGRLHIALQPFVEKHQLGITLLSPVDVYLTETNAFQPDLIYISKDRLSILGDRVEGAPDLVIEILSPSNAYYDLKQKKTVYESAGVREYWIVDPMEQSAEIYSNGDEGFTLRCQLRAKGNIDTGIFDGFEYNIKELWKPIGPT